ncbi:MAG: YafY family transcriptional regulator [Lachnospiraceae bacterium]|nr:YafY family transcriptional regulator [Lachnospiraceae bacterium]
MKIDRLIGILSILLQKDMVTAPELAEKFEVSRRTINRDIENLCKAGIPIRTTQGIGGGISIMDGYRVDRTLLTSKDMHMILAGLRSLDNVSGSNYYRQLMEKIKTGSSSYIGANESVLIDLSSRYKDSLASKIALIQAAIEENKILRFHYYAPNKNSLRDIETYFLIFKWSSWYVYGYCMLRKDFRMFKLNRMDQVSMGDTFVRGREVPVTDLENEHIFQAKTRVKAVFDASVKWHLIEEYGVESYEVQSDGSLLFEHEYFDDESLISWMLSYGNKVTVIEPVHIRERLFQITSDIAERYRKRG